MLRTIRRCFSALKYLVRWKQTAQVAAIRCLARAQPRPACFDALSADGDREICRRLRLEEEVLAHLPPFMCSHALEASHLNPATCCLSAAPAGEALPLSHARRKADAAQVMFEQHPAENCIFDCSKCDFVVACGNI
jgi:hypothetical protein